MSERMVCDRRDDERDQYGCRAASGSVRTKIHADARSCDMTINMHANALPGGASLVVAPPSRHS